MPRRVRPRAMAPYTTDTGTITGTGDIWADDSDATYLTLPDSVPVVAYYARGILQMKHEVGVDHIPAHAEVWVRYKATGPAPTIRLLLSGSGVLHQALAAVADAEPGWFRAPLSESDRLAFLANWDGSGLQYTYQFNSAFEGGAPLVVYEAGVAMEWGGGYAPPCRNIKRGDRLDLGGARNYPPSKMQQTSSRGVGAY